MKYITAVLKLQPKQTLKNIKKKTLNGNNNI